MKSSTQKRIDDILKKVSKEEIEEYFLTHSIKELYKHFGFSEETFKYAKKILQLDTKALKAVKNREALKKASLQNVKNKENRILQLLSQVPKEVFIEYKNSHTVNELLSHFSINQTDYDTLNKYYESKTSFESFEAILDRISQEEFIRFYITEAHSAKETREHFNLSEGKFYRFLQYHEISKNECKDSVKRTIVNSCNERLGVSNPMKSSQVRNKIKETFLEKYGTEYALQADQVKQKVSSTCLQRYGVPYYCMTDKCRGASTNESKPNLQFKSLLEQELGIVLDSSNREFSLAGKSYDFRIGNTLLEIDPAPTHNSTWGPFSNPKDKYYHYEKSRIAKENGYRCIHIFDWDDRRKVINLLKTRETVFARRCELRIVPEKEAKVYLNSYHLQSYVKADISLGLYYNDELVSLMSFGKPRYNKNYEYELLRYCAHKNVIGGAEKLFTGFVKQCKPKSIISYCDNSKFNGIVYSKLGYKLIRTGEPSKHWYNIKTKKHVTDNLLRQRGFDQLFNTNYGKGTSNEDLMRDSGFVEIYDCGQNVWGWRLESAGEFGYTPTNCNKTIR